jgi:CheY-like chemotaxis protein
MNRQKQNLNLLITTVASFISRVMRDNIEFTLSLHEEPLGVYVDDVQLEQVLLNLATNARDAMPHGGSLSITTAEGEMDEEYIDIHGFGRVGRYAVITVTDSGYGMDAVTKQMVFDPFFTTKEVGKGTGLGLSMALAIIKQHGGFIELQSESGKGCVFKLYLPLLADALVKAPDDLQDSLVESGTGTILLAEDDPATLSIMQQLLERSGYKVITAVDGKDAVKKFVMFCDEIQLVISDLIMPKKSGRQAFNEIRELSSEVRFIFMSGHPSYVIEREGGFGEDVEIIMKPVLPFDLLNKIGTIIGGNQ